MIGFTVKNRRKEFMENEVSLIPTTYDEGRITVLGRDLHSVLEINTEYRHWFKRMCGYGFEEGVDYIKFETEKSETSDYTENSEFSSDGKVRLHSGSQNPNPKINHQLTLEMAKEIAMIQRSEIGRKVRKYFIEIENRYREQVKVLEGITDLKAHAIDSAGQRAKAFNKYFGVSVKISSVHALGEVEKEFNIDLSSWKKLLPPVENVPTDYNPTQLAEKLSKGGVSFTAKQINSVLKDIGFQYKEDKQWKLTDKGKKYGIAYPYERNGHTGFQIRWKPEVVKIIEDCYFDY